MESQGYPSSRNSLEMFVLRLFFDRTESSVNQERCELKEKNVVSLIHLTDADFTRVIYNGIPASQSIDTYGANYMNFH